MTDRTPRAIPTSPPLLLSALAATVVFLALAASAAAQVSETALERCIRDNLTRYSDPSRADVNQYVDVVAECRAALSREEGVQVEITPIAPTRRGAPAAESAEGPEQAETTTDAPTPPSGAAPPTPGDPAAADPPARGAPGSPAPGLTPANPLAAEPASAGARTPLPGLSNAPAWVLVLLGVAIGLAIGGMVAGARRRFS